jgi:hypothetical protein
MLTRQRFITILLLTAVATGSALAQDAQTRTDPAATPTVTAAASSSGVRFTAPGAVVQMRLEVFSTEGEKVFDSGDKPGNVLDWRIQEQQGALHADASYLCTVTVRDLSGRLSQRHGLVSLSTGGVSLRTAERDHLTPAQVQAWEASRLAQSLEPAAQDGDALAIIVEDATPAVAVTAHDGTDGQVTRTRGAFSFRFGDFFSGKDTEQMRLTEEGNLGIGTAKPKVKLDVVGTISAREGLMFGDGSTLNVNDKGVLTRTTATGEIVPNIAGTGTQGQIAKWTDNAGTLGDSVITESASGFLGLSNTNPQSLLHVGPHPGYGATTGLLVANNLLGGQFDRALQLAPRQAASPLQNSILLYALPTINAGVTVPRQYGIFVDGKQGGGGVTSYAAIATGQGASLGATNNTHLLMGQLPIPTGNFAIFDNTGLRSFFSGNVGIGTTAPGAKLDVVGNINTSAQYNIGGNRILSVSGTANNNTFVGMNAGLSNPTGGGNSFFGRDAGRSNTTGGSNSFFGFNAGENNSMGGDNSFFGKDAGRNNTEGNANSFFGFEAGLANNGVANSFFGFNAGLANTTGDGNSFFGVRTGDTNTSGGSNSFFGNDAGTFNSDGNSNSFFGIAAGFLNTTGDDNVFVGAAAGNFNNTGNKNTVIGSQADVSAIDLNNATAIGHRALVSQNNSLVLGGIDGVNGAIADTKVGIGTSAPTHHLHVKGSSDQQIAIESSDEGGRQWTLQSSRGTTNGRFEIVDRTAGANRFTILSGGEVGIGTTTPDAKLAVNGNSSGGHVAVIRNFAETDGADGLLISISGFTSTLTTTNNFITFLKRDSSLGAIQANGSGGIELISGSADYAEFLPRLNPAEQIQAGDIIGLYEGLISKQTRGATKVMAVSANPIVVGNHPGEDARGGYERVAFIGQVMVRVRGKVQAGDFIVASGLNDGVGVAVSPEYISSEQFAQAVGQAWEASLDPGVKSVRTAVGLIQRDPTVSRQLEANRRLETRLSALQSESAALTKYLAALKTENAALRRQNSSLDARLSGLELRMRPKTARYKVNDGRARRTSKHRAE